MKTTYYGHNFVVFYRPDRYYKKDEIIEKYLAWAEGKRQQDRKDDDLAELKKLPDNFTYDYELPQWTGHAVRPNRVRADNNKLYEPVFISNVIDWK